MQRLLRLLLARLFRARLRLRNPIIIRQRFAQRLPHVTLLGGGRRAVGRGGTSDLDRERRHDVHQCRLALERRQPSAAVPP